MISIKLSKTVHPFLFALYQLLFLYAYNLDEVLFSETIAPAIALLLVTVIVFYALSLVLRDRGKAAVLVSFSLLMFFSYGHLFYRVIMGFELFGVNIGRHRFFLPLWTFISLIGAGFIVRLNRVRGLNKLITKLAVVMLLLALVNFGINLQRIHASKSIVKDALQRTDELKSTRSPEPLPDIYFILLDGYAGAESLRKNFDYDNTWFEKALTERGFFIPPRAVSNYPCTNLTLASELNLKHIYYLKESAGAESRDRSISYRILEDNIVVKFLKNHGYKYVHFDSGLAMTAGSPYADVWIRNNKYNSFAMLLMKTSMASAFLKYISVDERRARILNIFEKAGELPAMEGPIYAFMHVLAPHHPFVFGANGEPTFSNQMFDVEFNEEDSWRPREDYLAQLIFISKKSLELVDRLIEGSKTPPIIIMQADHGSASIGGFSSPTDEAVRERLSILNSYYFPGGGEQVLYEGITPVNSFRVLFNYYFGTNLELQEDKAYFSNYPVTPYDFTDVTDIVIEK